MRVQIQKEIWEVFDHLVVGVIDCRGIDNGGDSAGIQNLLRDAEADRTKLTHNTSHATIVLDGLAPIDRAIMEHAAQELTDLIRQYCGGEQEYVIMQNNVDSMIF